MPRDSFSRPYSFKHYCEFCRWGKGEHAEDCPERGKARETIEVSGEIPFEVPRLILTRGGKPRLFERSEALRPEDFLALPREKESAK